MGTSAKNKSNTRRHIVIMPEPTIVEHLSLERDMHEQVPSKICIFAQ